MTNHKYYCRSILHKGIKNRQFIKFYTIKSLINNKTFITLFLTRIVSPNISISGNH